MTERLSEGEREALIEAVKGGYDGAVRGVEALLAARLAPIEALAEDEKRRAREYRGTDTGDMHRCFVLRLRAALAASRPVHPAGDEEPR